MSCSEHHAVGNRLWRRLGSECSRGFSSIRSIRANDGTIVALERGREAVGSPIVYEAGFSAPPGAGE